MKVERKVQFSILSAVFIACLIYSQDKLSGVPRNTNSQILAGEKAWIAEAEKELATSKTDLVVIGNSMAGYGFDENLFNDLSGQSSVNLWRKGTSSAWFYLALKNLVLQNTKPSTIVIVFRDNILTRPELRVWGTYKKYLDSLVTKDSETLDRLAYLNHKNIDYYLLNYIPFYAERQLLHEVPKFAIQDFVSKNILNVEKNELSKSFHKAFNSGGIKYRNIGDETYYSSTILDPKNLDFKENVKDSFLPHMVDLCKEYGVNLVAVRIQRLVDQERIRDTELVDAYIKDLSDFADKENFTFIDFTYKDWLKRSHYTGNDHLNDLGKEVFTSVLYRELSDRNLLKLKSDR